MYLQPSIFLQSNCSLSLEVANLYGDQARDELPLVPNEHDISKEGGSHFDAVLNGNRSHVLTPGCDQDLCRRGGGGGGGGGIEGGEGGGTGIHTKSSLSKKTLC